MRDNNLGAKIFSVVINIVAVIILIIVMVQLNATEKRFISLSEKVKELDSKVSDLSRNQGQFVSSGNVETSTPTSNRKYLHPDVPNFLQPSTYKIHTPETKNGGILRRWYSSEPKSFNGLITNDGELNMYVGYYVYNESFAQRQWDEPNKYVPMLAERVEITDDYKEYTIYLKKGIKWHRPVVDWGNKRYEWLKKDHELTAKDVKFTVDMILNPQVECPHLRNYYNDLEYCKVIDDYTVVFRWKKKTYQALDFTIGLSPMPHFIYANDEDGKLFEKSVAGLKFNNHWYNNRPIGCGPYEFVSYEQGSSLKLKRFEDYYGNKPAISEIQYFIYPDGKQNVLKIKSRTQDFGIMYPTEYREEIVNGKPSSDFKNGKIKTGYFDETSFRYIGYNMDCPLFQDKRVRWAMSHSLNVPYILKNIYMDLGTPISGPFYFKSPAYDKSIPPIAYDLEKAKKLLDDAGWKDTDGDGLRDKVINGKKTQFEFSMLMPGGIQEYTSSMNIFKEALIKIGIKMTLSEVDWALMQKRMEDKDFQAMSGAWGLSWEVDPYQIWHSSQASTPKSSNHISYRNPEADKIIEELRVTFEPQKRVELYHKFHKLIYEEQPYTLLFNNRRCAVWWDNLDNVVFTPLRPYTLSLPWYFNSSTPKQNRM